jgi:hypothetical protein
MYKSFISTILSLFIISSCSLKNPLSKKDNLTYLDCPKSLILAPGKSLSSENINISLSRDYSISCYFTEDNMDDLIFDFNYELNIDVNSEELKKANADFWIFITNKEESEKILESSFTKTLDLSQVNQDNTQLSLFFRDAVELKRDQYDQGIKIFLSLN